MQSQIKFNTLREDSSSKLFGRNHSSSAYGSYGRSVRYAQHRYTTTHGNSKNSKVSHIIFCHKICGKR